MTDAVVKVAVGVMINSEGLILIAKRPDSKVLSGCWEFPGGKIEADEEPASALVREFQEEVGVTPLVIEAMDEIVHAYEHASVHLYVFKITDFSGEASNCEFQQIRWVKPEELSDYHFPEGNMRIIEALILSA